MVSPLRHTPLLPGTLQNLYYPPPDYVYFERADPDFFPAAGPIPKAAIAADAAMLAYARYGVTPMTDDQLKANLDRVGLTYQQIGNWTTPGTQALFASCPDYAICTFRGTERDDPKDLTSDADFLLVAEADHRPAAQDAAPALGHLNFITHLFAIPCMVHRGFQQALEQVWDQVHTLVTDYRSNNPGKEILFTGHSLGAALAVLAFSRFADPDISLFTFGCPRVGDAAFRDRVLQNPARGIYRFVNFNDAVTHVPTASFLYHQVPESCYRFDADGNLGTDDGSFKGDIQALASAVAGLPPSLRLGDLNTIPAPPGLVDHSPARYCYRLWDCV